jgi:hypothetical protein
VRKAPGTTDYRDMKKDGKAHPERVDMAPDGRQHRWWDETGPQCAQAVTAAVRFLQKQQVNRVRQQSISARLYGNIHSANAMGANYSHFIGTGQRTATKDRVTYNVTQSAVDTLTARVGETKPRAYYLSSGGSYKQQKYAKKLNQIVEGIFYETHTYDLGLKAFRDSAIWGDGFVHVFGRGGKVRHERVMSAELWMDETEAQYGNPRTIHRVKVIDRDELIGQFPKSKAKILSADRATDTMARSNASISDMVTVAESWHLGVMDEKGKMSGGLHAVTLVGADHMLTEPEEWEHNFFPFARIPWCERPLGYWSQGLCEQLQGQQIELNKNLWLIQRSMHMAGTVKVLIANGSKISKESINNEVGTVITYTGNKPEWVVAQPIHEIFVQNVERISQRMYHQAGVSEMSAAQKKPAGLNSGRALREAEDIESDRHRTISRQNDNLYMQIAALDLIIAKGMAERGELLPVKVPGKLAYNDIDWSKDLKGIDTSEFIQQCFPVSRLPRDPSGRLQTIQEYIQAGVISPRQGRRALDFADIDSIESLANAQEDLITSVLDAMVDDGKYEPPEPTDDLSLAKEMVVEYIQKFRTLDLEPERLDMLRNWSSQVDALVARAAPPMPAGSPGVTPQAAPMPQPTSDLVPNVPGPTA